MLVDKIIAQLRTRLEGVTDPDHTQWLYLFNEAAAYDVSGAYALQQDYIKSGAYHAFMEEIRQDPATRAAMKEMGPVVWAEGVPIFSYGCLLSGIDKTPCLPDQRR
jgi:hypothetical protein